MTVEENVVDFGKKMADKGEKVEASAIKKITGKFEPRKTKLISVTDEFKSKAQEKVDDVEEILDKGVNKSLHFIGVPSRKDMDQMTSLMKDMAESITELSTQLQDKKTTASSRTKKTTTKSDQTSVA